MRAFLVGVMIVMQLLFGAFAAASPLIAVKSVMVCEKSVLYEMGLVFC